MKQRAGILYVISAPSGAGKTSICKEIIDIFTNLRQSVSYTTRPRRQGEVDGRDYVFVSRARFEEMVAAGDFVEWASVHGNCYGTARATLEEAAQQGQDVLLDIDYQGAEQLRRSGVNGVFIFILPPSLAELRKRLLERDTDAIDVIEERMANSAGEIAQAEKFDYLVVNTDLAVAVETVKSIMLAEAVRTSRVLPTLPAEFAGDR